eukprot:CAMPEP_0184337302 /NCGR_PEP_ID=MMETSP1089-20130417/5686_1 /TAXON_ID=38269 ORGANISM="Gloeochaete wittrockiana, Strain SAG46.84" /NCGR_SAMPLE_ID=MMETSP1089 /ASSEMBLY_ACC=CAM_ASM_000445 /LENGTH=316 /DNA_ID=CAMNT_0026662929 /DNA_START=38 /DNA_END=988 /DNA_ORIENTATION=+
MSKQTATERYQRMLGLTNSVFETHTIETSRGRVVFHTEGDWRKQTLLFAYPDLGLNYINCLIPFIHSQEGWAIFHNFAIVYLSQPGIHPEAETLTDSYPCASLDDLVDQVEDIRKYLGAAHIFSLGVGAGSTVMIQYALRHPRTVVATIAIGGVFGAPSFQEWCFAKFGFTNLESVGLFWRVRDMILQRYFPSPDDRQENWELYQMYFHELEKIPPINLSIFLRSFFNRKGNLNDLSELQTPLLLLTSTLSPEHHHAKKIWHHVPNDRCEFVEYQELLDLIPTIEPSRLCSPITYFLQGIGVALPEPAAAKHHDHF